MVFIVCYFLLMMFWFLIDGVCELWIMRFFVWWLFVIFLLDRYYLLFLGILNIYFFIFCCYFCCCLLWYFYVYNIRWLIWWLISSIIWLVNFDYWCYLMYLNCIFFLILYICDREMISKDSINCVNLFFFERFWYIYVCIIWWEY